MADDKIWDDATLPSVPEPDPYQPPSSAHTPLSSQGSFLYPSDDGAGDVVDAGDLLSGLNTTLKTIGEVVVKTVPVIRGTPPGPSTTPPPPSPPVAQPPPAVTPPPQSSPPVAPTPAPVASAPVPGSGSGARTAVIVAGAALGVALLGTGLYYASKSRTRRTPALQLADDAPEVAVLDAEEAPAPRARDWRSVLAPQAAPPAPARPDWRALRAERSAS